MVQTRVHFLEVRAFHARSLGLPASKPFSQSFPMHIAMSVPRNPLAVGICSLGWLIASPNQGFGADLTQPVWGTIRSATNGTGVVSLEIKDWPTNGRLALPTPFPNITAAHWLKPPKASTTVAALPARVPVAWGFNPDATQIHLELPAQPPESLPAIVELETAEKTAQFAGGRITFSALDSTVQGSRAKLESHPGNHRIGFWTAAQDTVSWDFKPTRWGWYDLELAFSADGGTGTQVEIAWGNQKVTVDRPSTGTWYRYQTLTVGRIHLEKSEPFTLKVGCASLKGVAVMNLKSVTLRPAPEGPMPVQDATGVVTLLSSSATTHSVMMRYEPAQIKNCMGYWVNPADWADWEFKIQKPGRFTVEVLQGCGKGQGGSDVVVEVGGMRFPFVVEDTGHFQNFVPRQLGEVQLDRPGTYSLAVKPQRKQAGAIMDIRQVRLVPVAK